MLTTYPKGYKLQLSPNFNLQEFHCHCTSPACQTTLICDYLIKALQQLREVAGPLTINSGFRCAQYNASIRGAAQSFHKLGMAADCVPRFIKPQELKAFALKVPALAGGGIGLYKWGCHLDVRPTPHRWLDPTLNDDSWKQS